MFGRKSKEKIRQLQAAMSAEATATERLRAEIDRLSASLRETAERADIAESELAAARAANKALKALNARLTKKSCRGADMADMEDGRQKE